MIASNGFCTSVQLRLKEKSYLSSQFDLLDRNRICEFEFTFIARTLSGYLPASQPITTLDLQQFWEAACDPYNVLSPLYYTLGFHIQLFRYVV